MDGNVLVAMFMGQKDVQVSKQAKVGNWGLSPSSLIVFASTESVFWRLF